MTPNRESSETFGRIEPWSTDPRLDFDRIHVVESLPEPGWSCRTGARLAEELDALCATTPAISQLHVVRSKSDLFGVLNHVVIEARNGRVPVLHFEMHGIERLPGRSTTSVGLMLASDEVVAWTELAPLLIEINESTRLKLIVVVAACYGADVASLIQPLDRAPARVLIGPIRSLSFNAVELATMAFYKSLFQEHDLHAAIDAMNIATPPGDGGVFFPFTAERMFLQILKDYYNDETNETRIAARVEPYMVDFLLRGMPPAEVQRRRTLMRDRLRDRHAVFDQSYRKFFFVDRYPEIANRFRMTYESCFMEAGPPRDMSSLC